MGRAVVRVLAWLIESKREILPLAEKIRAKRIAKAGWRAASHGVGHGIVVRPYDGRSDLNLQLRRAEGGLV